MLGYGQACSWSATWKVAWGHPYNGGWYTVSSVDHSEIRLKGEYEMEFEITSQDGMAKLRLTNALTYACVQELTLKGQWVRLCDANHPRFEMAKDKRRHLEGDEFRIGRNSLPI